MKKKKKIIKFGIIFALQYSVKISHFFQHSKNYIFSNDQQFIAKSTHLAMSVVHLFSFAEQKRQNVIFFLQPSLLFSFSKSLWHILGHFQEIFFHGLATNTQFSSSSYFLHVYNKWWLHFGSISFTK